MSEKVGGHLEGIGKLGWGRIPESERINDPEATGITERRMQRCAAFECGRYLSVHCLNVD